MEPLIAKIADGIDPALMRVLEKRGGERDAAPRRKRPANKEKPIEEEEVTAQDPDTPQHTLDDLA
jgi:hypothetical protein